MQTRVFQSVITMCLPPNDALLMDTTWLQPQQVYWGYSSWLSMGNMNKHPIITILRFSMTDKVGLNDKLGY